MPRNTNERRSSRTQTAVGGHYVEKSRLDDLLRTLFQPGTFEAQVTHDSRSVKILDLRESTVEIGAMVHFGTSEIV